MTPEEEAIFERAQAIKADAQKVFAAAAHATLFAQQLAQKYIILAGLFLFQKINFSCVKAQQLHEGK